MFWILFSWLIGQWGQKISCTKTRTLPNLRLPISSVRNIGNPTHLSLVPLLLRRRLPHPEPRGRLAQLLVLAELPQRRPRRRGRSRGRPLHRGGLPPVDRIEPRVLDGNSVGLKNRPETGPKYCPRVIQGKVIYITKDISHMTFFKFAIIKGKIC